MVCLLMAHSTALRTSGLPTGPSELQFSSISMIFMDGLVRI